MRSTLIPALLVALGGCAARQHSGPQEYACTTGPVATYVDAQGLALHVGEQRAALTDRDADGDHYVLDATEYVVPRDRRLDATLWARTSANGRVPVETCLASGGHRDLVKRRIIDNQTIAQIATSLGEDRATVRRRLVDALRWMKRDLGRERSLPAPLAAPISGNNGRQDLLGRQDLP
jgi:hypothetical protein